MEGLEDESPSRSNDPVAFPCCPLLLARLILLAVHVVTLRLLRASCLLACFSSASFFPAGLGRGYRCPDLVLCTAWMEIMGTCDPAIFASSFLQIDFLHFCFFSFFFFVLFLVS